MELGLKTNNGTWSVKKWQIILTLIILLGTILGQLLLAQGWKTNIERDVKERPTYEETRKIVQNELLQVKDDIREIKTDIKSLLRNK